MTSPVAGHLDSTTGPDPLHCPSYTPGMDPSVGNDKADKTRLALEDRCRLNADTDAPASVVCR